METETQTEKERLPQGQLIFVTRKDTARLLEVYVKRSLSLNDGTVMEKRAERRKKWVTMPERKKLHKQIRRHSSNPDIYLGQGSTDGEIGTFAVVESPANQPEKIDKPGKKPKKPKKPKKTKKPSLWKSFLGLFSRKGSDEKEEEQECRPDVPEVFTSSQEDSDASASCLPVTPDSVQKRKSVKRKTTRRKFPKRRLSLRKSIKRDAGKDLNPADITGVESVEIVEPTYSYYEKVSEEMERIVHEVKEKEEVLTDEEVINRIIALTKKEGDAIENKMKENPTLSGFFQKMTYSSFQKLVDAYLETEASPTYSNQLNVPPTAPELVSLAFTLDFTARVASLSRQNIGHITGLGNRYLEDRFEYKQASTDHPWSDSDDAND
ncbi:uncharacterized protein LOC115359723 isoform X2 [Myripristis murdjan]|uniref:uncharacterized protein LOC115359723 isoform X2 n=1 Tax=Myripristis murdjan TaxID=586833 RepID=UPI001175D612|nr:uncharacterized protein LOC115359723 isoform X2 [Myripristis murdjan]